MSVRARHSNPALAAVLLAGLVALVVGMLGMSADAGAAKPKVGASVTFSSEFADTHILYYGQVSSSRKACYSRRPMRMEPGGGGPSMGSFTSKRDGSWRHTELTDGINEYRIVLLRKVTPKVICKRVVRDFETF